MNYEPTYNAVHKWLVYNFGKAYKCEHCFGLSGSKRFEYALMKDHKYEKKRDNFIQLCKRCHVIYDQVIERLTLKKYKPVYAATNNKIYKFTSVALASKGLDISRTAISNALTGRAKTAGGYRWQYA